MNPADIVADVRALGVVISECNGRLFIKPASRIPQELLTLVKDHRHELVAHLVAFRDAERLRVFGPTVLLTAELLEPRACSSCGSTNWWRRRTGGHRSCGVCRPPAVDAADIELLSVQGGDDAT